MLRIVKHATVSMQHRHSIVFSCTAGASVHAVVWPIVPGTIKLIDELCEMHKGRASDERGCCQVSARDYGFFNCPQLSDISVILKYPVSCNLHLWVSQDGTESSQDSKNPLTFWLVEDHVSGTRPSCEVLFFTGLSPTIPHDSLLNVPMPR